MASRKTIVVVGGFYGGPQAAVRARQTNEHARIVLLEEAPLISWIQQDVRACLSGSLHFDHEKLIAFQKRYNIEVITNTRVVALDLDAHCLMHGSAHAGKRLKFDALIYAGTHTPPRLVDDYGDFPVVLYRDSYDVTYVKKALRHHVRHVTVMGDDPGAIELALTLRELGLAVQLMVTKKRVLPQFSMSFSLMATNKLETLGIQLLYDELDKAHTDLLIICERTKPQLSMLTNAQAALDADGLIRVDDRLSTTLPEVYACGNAISVPVAVLNQRASLPYPAVYTRTAQIAGFNAACDNEQKEIVRPFCGAEAFMVDELCGARVGVSEQEASRLCGHDNVQITTVFGAEGEADASEETYLRLLVDASTEKVIGAEAWGKQVLPTMQLLSIAVLEGWHPQKLVEIDAPYVNQWQAEFDPLKEAALRAKHALKKSEFSLSHEQLALWLASKKPFHLVDVGEISSFTAPSAKTMHVPLEQLRERSDELLGLNEPVVLYAQSGDRSYMAHLALRARGMKNVFHLDGGAATWNLVARE